MFWDKFMALCKSRGISPAQFAREVKISNGILTKWKSGSLPGTEALLKISQYFDVTIDYLLNDDDIDDINEENQCDKKTDKLSAPNNGILMRRACPSESQMYEHYTVSLKDVDLENFTYEYSYDNESPEARRIRESIINTLNEMNTENLKKTEEIIRIIKN